MRARGTTLLLAAALGFVVASCGGGGDTAGALDDRLLDALDFDGGEVVDGTPPAGTEGAAAPQVDLLDAPGTLVLGSPFILAITTGFTLPAEVTRAVVYVGDEPTRHIVVTHGLVPSGQAWLMNLAGVLAVDNQLRDKSFVVHVALQTAAGVTGAYSTWNLAVADREAAPVPGNPIEEITVAGEEWHSSDRPAGSLEPGVPQVGSIEAPSKVSVGVPFTMTLLATETIEVPDGTSGIDVAAVLVSTPGNAGYKLTSGFTVRPAVRQGESFLVDVGLTVADPRLRGFSLVLLFALQNAGGKTGLFQPVGLDVDAGAADGDPDGDRVDGDTASDGDAQADGDTVIDAGIVWIRVPAGTFTMGCSLDDKECTHSEEVPGHDVSVPAYELSQTEITQEQYRRVTGLQPSHFSSCGDSCPVEMVDWQEARAFCEAVGGRLPSEAEWEYAARGGTTTSYYCGNDDACLDYIAWYTANSDNRTHPVAGRAPNDFGLYDMLGNVTEWVEDCWHPNYDGAPSTGGVWEGGECSLRALRGGSWETYLWTQRVSYRTRYQPDVKYSSFGFRCARATTAADGDAIDGDVVTDGDAQVDGDTDGEEIPDLLCADGVCLDPATGFEWQQAPSFDMHDWSDAIAFCQNLNLLGTGWRLPNISELRSLIRGCPVSALGGSCGVQDICQPCGMGSACLANSCLDSGCSCELLGGGCYWPSNLEGECDFHSSASSVVDVAVGIWGVNFGHGSVGEGATDNVYHFRCVR